MVATSGRRREYSSIVLVCCLLLLCPYRDLTSFPFISLHHGECGRTAASGLAQGPPTPFLGERSWIVTFSLSLSQRRLRSVGSRDRHAPHAPMIPNQFSFDGLFFGRGKVGGAL